MNSTCRLTIPKTYTARAVPGDRDNIPTPETARQWSHLEHLHSQIAPLQPCEIALLIGFNCSAAHLRLKQVEQIHFTHKIVARELTPDEVLQCLSEDLDSDHHGIPTSQNDILFMKKMDESTSQENGHYIMPLPFKETPSLPNNRSNAMKRFRSLERKLHSDPQLNTKYREFMEDIIAKGEAEISNSSQPGWYIPHFGVSHPLKPDKLRVVFDCSAVYGGHSLNQHLLQGPDLNNNLTGLLCRFRKEKVAFTCDIQRMFHQFRVAKNDRRFLRFLWYDSPNSDRVVDYQMNVHLFGAASSPSCAIYGLKRLAKDYSSEYPSASSFIQENFYVDDGLISLPTAEAVIKLANEAKELANKGSLVLHKFLSNSPEVAAALGCDNPAMKDLESDPMIARALGLSWDISHDTFRFSDHVADKPATRRGILSTVASVFDPLGLLTPFTLLGKLLVQELCREKKGWDESLSPDQLQKWNAWLGNLVSLQSFSVPRCVLGSLSTYDDSKVQLHIFSDASSIAYGMCAYLRIVNQNSQQVAVTLIMGKSRVTPKRAVTIPRLELQAATLAVRVGDFLTQELHYPECQQYYWSDSKSVLGYISNEARCFHTYVCNRVQRIRDSTTPTQWNYIRTDENPADLASRGTKVSQFSSSWLYGPEFLSDASFSVSDLCGDDFKVHEDDPEVRKVFTLTTFSEDKLEFLRTFDKYSEWERIWSIIRCILSLTITNPEDRIMHSILIMLQKAYFSEEIDQLQQSVPQLKKTSVLYKLDPFIDQSGVLRVGGRLKNSLAPFSVNHPAVMPAKAHITKLFARSVHKETAHQGRMATINAIRLKGVFLVSQGNRLVASIIHHCVKCQRLRGSPMTQKMSDLPEERVEPTAPFSHVGMDVFGPFICKDVRREVKRYGLIFTCLSSRAVHLELLDDMTSDCFINSLRCFIAIRGPVQTLLSDQGTNFVGAKGELDRSQNDMIDEKTKEFLKAKSCTFKFNVPGASHMGGTWERLIRTVRSVLNGILLERHTARLDTTSLRTLLYECMAIVNSRPLTAQQLIQDSSVDPLPLNPNMLLTMKTDSPSAPPQDFDEHDLCSRKRWRRVQYLAEQFWARWKLEYLQSLQKRQKWSHKVRDPRPDDIVVLIDDSSPRLTWKLARVLKPIPSKDGLTRKVTLRLSGGQLLDRPIHKLIMLLPSTPKHNGSIREN